MENFTIYIEWVARIIEGVGVLIIALGAALALARYSLSKQGAGERSYHRLRQEIGKAILIGLEILVAADIIATVVTEPDMQKVLTLGVIVLIRTFLSFSLQVELEGKWPWQQAEKPAAEKA